MPKMQLLKIVRKVEGRGEALPPHPQNSYPKP